MVDIPNRNRRLQAYWSREAAQDLWAFHNVQALEEIFAQEITAEIDAEILGEIRRPKPTRDDERRFYREGL